MLRREFVHATDSSLGRWIGRKGSVVTRFSDGRHELVESAWGRGSDDCRLCDCMYRVGLPAGQDDRTVCRQVLVFVFRMNVDGPIDNVNHLVGVFVDMEWWDVSFPQLHLNDGPPPVCFLTGYMNERECVQKLNRSCICLVSGNWHLETRHGWTIETSSYKNVCNCGEPIYPHTISLALLYSRQHKSCTRRNNHPEPNMLGVGRRPSRPVLIRSAVAIFQVDRTPYCGRSSNERQQSV